MSWVAAGIVGGSVLGGLITGNAAENAADTQAAAADRASQTQERMFNTVRADLDPWKQRGLISLRDLADLSAVQRDSAGNPILEQSGALIRPFAMSDFQESPAFQFNLQQGQRAIENAASRNRTLYAPATLQDIGKYSQGLASNEFQNAMNNYYGLQDRVFNRLHAISGSGQNAAAQTGAFSATAANQIGNNIIGAGNAQAAGQMGQANAINGAIGQGINGMFMNRYLNNQADYNNWLRQMQQPSVSLRDLPTGDFGGGPTYV